MIIPKQLQLFIIILIFLNIVIAIKNLQDVSGTMGGNSIPIYATGSQIMDDTSKDILMKKVYYSIRADLKKCVTPNCGGYYIKKLNMDGSLNLEDSKEIYILEMMSSDPKLNTSMLMELKSSMVRQLTQNNDMIFIVAGEISPSHSHDGAFNCLHITDILKLMKLPTGTFNKSTIKAQEKYYFLKSSPFKCNSRVENCPSLVGLKVNSHDVEFIQSYSEFYSTAIPMLDEIWFTSRLVSDNSLLNAIVKGYIVDEKLMISMVFLNTVDPASGKCDNQPRRKPSCDKPNQVPTFTRSIDRCPIFSSCVERGPCHVGIPNCIDGYITSSIQIAPKGCLKYYCDPDFLIPTKNIWN